MSDCTRKMIIRDPGHTSQTIPRRTFVFLTFAPGVALSRTRTDTRNERFILFPSFYFHFVLFFLLFLIFVNFQLIVRCLSVWTMATGLDSSLVSIRFFVRSEFLLLL